MSIVRRSRRLAWRASCATLTISLACAAAGGAQDALADAGGRAAVNFPLDTQKAAASWGYNPVGQLGTGTVDGYKNPAAIHPHFGQVIGLTSGVVQVSAGATHALALRSDGTVWAWGNGTSGQLGNGTLSTTGTPVQVPGLTGIVAVSAGTDDSLALRSDGTVWAWGDNQFGQLGNGTTAGSQPTPVQVTGLAGVTRIAAGGQFNLALRSDGSVWAWGFNQFGELGNGTTVNSAVPVHVSGLSHITRIAAGQYTSLAIRSADYTGLSSLWEWGLSNGTSRSHFIPAQVTGIRAPGIAGITAGSGFALALGTDGSVWGWGADSWGQLGNGPHPDTTSPVRTLGPGSGITQLSAGQSHALALKSDGTVLAWGFNDTGALGDGVRTTPTGPVRVTGLTGVSQVSAGWQFSLAVYAALIVAKGPSI